MSMNRQGRKSGIEQSSGEQAAANTHSGNRALQIEEPILFDLGDTQTTGVDFIGIAPVKNRLNGMERTDEFGLAGLSEPETMRHYVRLSQKNYSIDTGIYPLGSCTMKHNPRLNEKMARLPGFMDIHPLQPQSSVPGAIEVMSELAHWLMELTGMKAIAFVSKGWSAWRTLRDDVDQSGP